MPVAAAANNLLTLNKQLKFPTEMFRSQVYSKWQCNKIAGPNSSNLLHFLQVEMQMVSVSIIFAVRKEGL